MKIKLMFGDRLVPLPVYHIHNPDDKTFYVGVKMSDINEYMNTNNHWASPFDLKED